MPAPPLIAWVDSVGAALLVAGESFTLGGPPRGGEAADLPLVAPLRAVHARVFRSGEGWAVEGVGGPLDGATGATEAPADRFSLGERGSSGETGGVRVAVAAPNALSPAAVVTVTSGHQPVPGWDVARLEAAVIAAGPVIFGAGPDCHVRVRAAAGRVLLRATADGWSVRGAGEGVPEEPRDRPGEGSAEPAGGSAALGWRPVAAGAALTGSGVSLRLAAVPGP